MSIFETIANAIRNLCHGPLTDAEVDRALAAEAAKRDEDLNWGESIVDLLKLLPEITDTSLAGRKALAAELGFEGYDGSAAMNVALVKEVRNELRHRYMVLPK